MAIFNPSAGISLYAGWCSRRVKEPVVVCYYVAVHCDRLFGGEPGSIPKEEFCLFGHLVPQSPYYGVEIDSTADRPAYLPLCKISVHSPFSSGHAIGL